MTYIRQAEMAQEIAELTQENARLRAQLRKALGMGSSGPPFFWLGAEAEPALGGFADCGWAAPTPDRWNAPFPSPEARR